MLNPQQLDALAAEFRDAAYDGKTKVQAVALLEQESVVTAQKSRAKPYTVDDLTACVSDTATAALALGWVNYPAFLADVNAGNTVRVAHWAAALAGAGKIQPAELTAINGVLAATEDYTAVVEYKPPRLYSIKNPTPAEPMPNTMDPADIDAAWAAAGRA